MDNERERIEQILHRYDEIIASMGDPAIVSDGARYLKLTKELSDLEPVVTRIHDKDRVVKELAEARELHTAADDEEMRQMAADEVDALEQELSSINEDLEDLLAVKDPKDDRSVIMEIRSGAGGEEAALFVADLYKMYSAFAISIHDSKSAGLLHRHSANSNCCISPHLLVVSKHLGIIHLVNVIT